jgi:uroporphyrinogen-III synthase
MDAANPLADALQGRSFVLTRPVGENRRFADELRRRGAEVVVLAPFRIVARADPELLKIELRAAANVDVVVFASTLAVRHVFALLPDWMPRARVIAQGPATQQALAEHSVAASTTEGGFRSEDLIHHPGFDGARRVVRITGAGGRDWLVKRLRERGIDATDLPVYLREPCVARAETLRRIDAMAHPETIVSSREALLALPALLGNERWQRLAKEPMYLSSDRLAGLARSLQCTQVVAGASARVGDLLAAIATAR